MSNYCTTAQVKSDLGITDTTYDNLFDALCEAISDAIDAECQREGRLYNRSATEYFDIEFGKIVYHPVNTPVVSVSGHYLRNSEGVYELDTTREVYVYDEYIKFEAPFFGENVNSVFIGSTVTNTEQALRVDMIVGFFAEGSTPQALNMLAREMVTKQYNKIQNKTGKDIKSEKIGNYSVTYGSANGDKMEDYSGDLKNSGLYSILQKYKREINYGHI
jgi:hypothetical protein